MPNATLWTIQDNKLDLRLHPGQARAWDSTRRFVAILAGTQSGKTSFLPWWLWREIERCGPGDYLAVTSSYDLFKLKFLPAIRETFEHALRRGRYWSGDRVLELADPTTGKFLARRADDPMWARIVLRSAESATGLESATARAAILDEAGQDSFTLDAWHAVLRRLALHRGRVLLGTTLYNLGWLKREVYDRWRDGNPDYDVIQFDSTENPEFPADEARRARATMPLWQYNMQYRGRYERPAGLIYDSFDEAEHVVPRFAVPLDWPRYLGLDFGGVNTAGLFLAREPGTGRLYAYREYWHGGRTARQHAAALLAGEPGVPTCVGGARSEGQWRDEFRAAGLPVREPDIRDVELGITRVYGVHARGGLYVFSDLANYLDQKRSYSRALDALGQPTTAIDQKPSYHLLDAERYIVGWLERTQRVYHPVAGGRRPVASVR